MSDPLRPRGLQFTRLLCPWNSLGKYTGVGCHSLLQGIFPTQRLNPRLPHWRQILYHLSHWERPDDVCISVNLFVNMTFHFPPCVGYCLCVALWKTNFPYYVCIVTWHYQRKTTEGVFLWTVCSPVVLFFSVIRIIINIPENLALIFFCYHIESFVCFGKEQYKWVWDRPQMDCISDFLLSKMHLLQNLK